MNLMVHYPLDREIMETTGFRKGTEEYFKYCKAHYENFTAITLGYEGMSTEETEAAILQKYQGKNTFVDFLNMQGELYDTGVLNSKMGKDGAWRYMRVLHNQICRTYFTDNYINGIPTTQDQWDSITNMDFDAKTFLTETKEYIKNISFGNAYNFDMKSVLDKGINDLLNALEQRDQV